RAGVRDERVLEAVRDIDRATFLPAGEERARDLDRPVPIGHGQTTSQPSLIAMMIAALDLTGDENVLEIGTGLGYQAALLSRLARHVTTVERFEDLARAAEGNLAEAGIDNVDVIAGDGTKGFEENAPYDAIVVAAAFTDVPQPLSEQLRDGGRLVQPVGPGGSEQVAVFHRSEGQLERTGTLVGARFVRLVGEHGFADG
ncbi:MAG: protein-L-isoaspartate(D-aspartate) O-methyltransferase, partial [Nitriliruptorales bacterium]|nr:protein-L-isoaspartate(D-aspartate) O-methyltransferase [Nitriliruptorales bacterium]